MVESRSLGDRMFDVINILLLIGLALVTLYPLLYVLFASVSDPTQFMKKEYTFLVRPLGFQLQAYRFVFKNSNVMLGFRNTAFYVVAGTAISMFMTFLASFVLARKNYLMRGALTKLIMFTMYFSGGLVPFFMVVLRLNWIDSVWAILIPSALSTYNVIVLRTAFMSLPDSLEESARIDGAHDLTVLFRIYLPLSIPTIAVVGLFYAVGRWNAWFNAVIFLRRRELYPIQLVLREILITSNASYMNEMGSSIEMSAISELVKYATIVVATIPVLLIYPFLQKYFVKGMMIGAIKG